MHEFDKTYWENHWSDAADQADVSQGGGRQVPANPYLLAESAHLPPGTALNVGCGTGAEALWLAGRNWSVTDADISASALAAAIDRAARTSLSGRVEWVEADLTTWEPDRSWDLVVTSYAHPQTGQLAFYQRIAFLGRARRHAAHRWAPPQLRHQPPRRPSRRGPSPP